MVLSSCCDLSRIIAEVVRASTTTTISGNAAQCVTAEVIRMNCVIVDDDIALESPTDVSNTLTIVPTVIRVNGSLTIGGPLDAFPNFATLTFVQGNLVIGELSDASLITLSNIFPLLEEVQGSLIIQNNAEVQTIRGFTSLREVGGNVEIGSATLGQGNALLRAAPALNVLTTIGGNPPYR